MSTDRLEQDPVSQPRCCSCLETGLTRLVGVWGPAEGLVSGVPDESVRGLAFLSSKPWLVIARLAQERSGPGDALRAVTVPSGYEVPVPYFPDDVETKGRHRGCWSLDVDESDQLLAAMSDGTVRVLDGPTGQERRRFDLAAEIIAYAGPGQFVAATATGIGRYDLPSGSATAAIHDLATGAKVASLPIEEKYLHGMASDAAGNRIVLGITGAAGGSSVRCVDRKGSILWETPFEGSFSTSSGPVAISRDGRIVAVTAWSGKLRFFDGETGALRRELKESRNCSSPVFSGDGKRLALSLHSRAVAIADTEGVVTGDRDDGASDVFAFSPDGSLIASVGRGGSVNFSSVPGAKPVAAARGFERGFALDATRVALADAGGNAFLVADHEGAVSRRIPRNAGQERVLAITPNGHLIVQPRRFERGAVVRLEESGATPLYDGPASECTATAACTPARLIALGIADATLVDVVTGARTELAGAHDPEWGSGDDTGDHNLTAGAVSPDGTLAATSSSDGTIALWSLPAQGAGKLLHRFTVMYKDEHVRSRADALAFSRDAALLFAVVAVHYGPRLYAYDVATRQIRYEINRKDAPMVPIAPAVAEHRRLVAFATEDGVLLCSPDDGRVLDRLRIGDQPAALAFAEPHLFVQTSRGQLLRFRLG